MWVGMLTLISVVGTNLSLLSNMPKITFVAIERDGCRDGTYGYEAQIDGVTVVDFLESDINMADDRLDPVWEALGLTVEFDYD